MLQAVCNFAGLQSTKGWSFTLGPGVQPSTGTISVIPRDDAGFTFGEFSVTHGFLGVTFPDCIVTNAILTGARGGRTWRLTIKDRRWKWAYSIIHGSYNERQPDGSYVREKTPQELASLLFDAMGESGYDVSRLPNATRPAADWQRVKAAPLLQSLCNSLGCMPTLNPLTNKAEIWPIGVGLPLPGGTKIITESLPINYGSIPDQVRVVTAPAKFEIPMILEAVGIDVDGSIKLVNDLSYTPAGGWGDSDPWEHYLVSGEYTVGGKDYKKRELAKSSVWKMYRYKELDVQGGGFTPESLKGTDFEPDKREQLLPLFDTKAFTTLDADGIPRKDPAVVRGTFADNSASFGSKNAVYPRDGYTIDTQKGIVVFSEPVFHRTSSIFGIQVVPANLALETSFGVTIDGVKVNYEYFRDRDPAKLQGTGPEIMQRPDLVAQIVEDEDGLIVSDNSADIQQQAEYYLDEMVRRYDEIAGKEQLISHIFPWAIDGLTQQITWSGGNGQPAKTRISQGTNHNPYIPDYAHRAKESEQEAAAEKAAGAQT